MTNKSTNNQGQDKGLASFSRWGQACFIGGLVVVLTLLLVPLSPGCLDVFLALSIMSALFILVLSVSITSPAKFFSFPSLLLICTLFRLGLNVSSTRLILGTGEAGDIITTFGNFAASGNVIVGIIIFLVLTVIQYVVVSKGSDRVAEVAARFSLDALPGKQMSIDADLRAGMISSEAAGSRRSALVKESKLYGSMDGAMKFIKGEAVAGFIITFINIVAGIGLGVFDHGYSLSEAARHYTILTIGDGLVAQIPALLVSVAAGFVVTRVSDEEHERSLGGDLGAQMLSNPAVMFTGAGLGLFVGMIPGLPFGIFFVLSAILAGMAVAVILQRRNIQREALAVETHHVDEGAAGSGLGQASPFLLELSPNLYDSFCSDARWQACFNVLVPKLRQNLANNLGVAVPPLKIQVNTDLSAQSYVIKIYEVPVEQGHLSPAHSVVRTDSEVTRVRAIELLAGERTDKTVHGSPVLLVNTGRHGQLSAQGIKVYSPEETLVKHLAEVLKSHVADFVGIQEVKDILSLVETTHSELVREVIPRMLSVHKLTDVIKRLVEEGVSVRDFRLILETLAGTQPEDKSAVDLVELVRRGLSRQLTHRYAGLSGTLSCFGLDPEIEDEITANIKREGQDYYLTLSPERINAINLAVKSTLCAHEVRVREAVILTTAAVRRYVRKCLAVEMPEVAVLSYQELDPRVHIDLRDTISVQSLSLVVA